MRLPTCLSLVTLLLGCSSLQELREPANVPTVVGSYRIAALSEKTGDVPVALSLDECVEEAVLVSHGLTGGTSVVGTFPVRSIIEREFQKVIAANFRVVLPTEQPKLELRIESRQISVSRSWSKVACEMEFHVEILDPELNRRPYFVKNYQVSSTAIVKIKDEVPVCVYSCIQHFANDFMQDVTKNRSLVTRLRELSDEG